MKSRAVRMLVRGRVQRVGFRYFVVQNARELGLAGSVRNCDDGSVEIIACGNELAVDAMTGIVRVGPPSAVVTAVVVTDADPASEYPSPFALERTAHG